MIRKILIGIDDSKFAEHAADYGFDLAVKFGAAVGLVSIIEPVVLPQGNTTGIDPVMGMPFQNAGLGVEDMEVLEIQKNHADNIVNQTIERFKKENIEITHFTDFGSTADGILSCGKEYGADLIVIGTHSRTGLDRFLMGSVAEDVIRHADVPVLVVPFKDIIHD